MKKLIVEFGPITSGAFRRERMRVRHAVTFRYENTFFVRDSFMCLS
jgi:hypothetical protein